MVDYYAVSDYHFSHKSIAGPKISSWTSGYRNFDSTEEMDELLIENTNRIVKKNDILIFGGDFLMGPDKLENFKRLRARLNVGVILFNRGNHDDEWMLKKNNLEEVEKIVGKTYLRWEGKIGGKYFVVGHYAQRVWNHMKESYHLFAHSHNNLSPLGRSCDIGVDTFHNGHKIYTPYHIMDELVPFLDKQPEPKEVDHHIN